MEFSGGEVHRLTASPATIPCPAGGQSRTAIRARLAIGILLPPIREGSADSEQLPRRRQ
jgi:hypothetical protein